MFWLLVLLFGLGVPHETGGVYYEFKEHDRVFPPTAQNEVVPVIYAGTEFFRRSKECPEWTVLAEFAHKEHFESAEEVPPELLEEWLAIARSLGGNIVGLGSLPVTFGPGDNGFCPPDPDDPATPRGYITAVFWTADPDCYIVEEAE